MIRQTCTYAILDLSPAAYAEIRAKLHAAGYEHAFHEDGEGRAVVDMHGIAVRADSQSDAGAMASDRVQITELRRFATT